MNIEVPSMAPGDGSLPADLRAGRAGYYSTGRNRLLMGQRGTGMSVEPVYAMSGMGEIMRGMFVVPQNPIVTPNSNPVAVRVDTGGSGIGRLRRVAALQGIRGLGDVCDPADPAYDPADPSCTGGGGGGGGGGVDLSAGFGYDPNTTPPPVMETPYPIVENVSPVVTYQIPSSAGVVGSGPSGYMGQTSYPAGQTPPQAPAGYQWAQVTNQAGQTLAQVLAVAQGGASISLPNGNKLIYGSPASAATAGTAGALANTVVSPSVLLVLGGVLVVMLMMRGR